MIVTINSTDYEVFEDEAGITLYAQAQLSSDADAWLAADPLLQARGAVSATRLLNALAWTGAPTDEYQPLAWPRSGMFDAQGQPLPDNVIPQSVLDADSLIAMGLVAGSPVQNDPNAQVTRSLKAGSVAIDYFRNIDPITPFPKNITELIALWLGGTNLFAAEASGTCERTSFDQEYRFVRGF
jgi:hypothetical protein